MIKSVSKKIATSLIALSFASVGVMETSQSVNAASWHKGTPKAMQGIWKTKAGYKMKIGKTNLNFGPKLGSSPAKYKYLGQHKYAVNTKLGGTFKVTATAHHLKMQGTTYYK